MQSLPRHTNPRGYRNALPRIYVSRAVVSFLGCLASLMGQRAACKLSSVLWVSAVSAGSTVSESSTQ